MIFYVGVVKGNCWLGHLMGVRHCGSCSVVMERDMCSHMEKWELCWADLPCGSTHLIFQSTQESVMGKTFLLRAFLFNLCPVNINFWTLIWLERKKKRKSAIKKIVCWKLFPPSFPGLTSPAFVEAKVSLSHLLWSDDRWHRRSGVVYIAVFYAVLFTYLFVTLHFASYSM